MPKNQVKGDGNEGQNHTNFGLIKDLGEVSYILGIQVIRYGKNRTIALSQASYIDKILSRFSMQDSKRAWNQTF